MSERVWGFDTPRPGRIWTFPDGDDDLLAKVRQPLDADDLAQLLGMFPGSTVRASGDFILLLGPRPGQEGLSGATGADLSDFGADGAPLGVRDFAGLSEAERGEG